MINKSFTNSIGRNYLNALFFETTDADKSTVMYTLKRRDHLGYPSLHRLYLEANDPTEYKFAVAHLNGWSHWQELTQCSWFQPYLEEWRKELEVALRSAALTSIIETARDSANSNSYHANKYLLEGNWKPAGEKKRGRPSKDEVKAEIMRQAASNAEIADDAKRIGIN